MTRANVNDQIVPLSVLGVIFLGIVNDVVCAERTDHVQISRIGDGGDFGSERLGDLYRECPYSTARTVNQDLLSGLDVSMVSEGLQGCESSDRDRGGFFKRAIFGLQCYFVFFC